MQAAQARNDIAALQAVVRRRDYHIPMMARNLRVQYLYRETADRFHHSCRECGLSAATDNVFRRIFHLLGKRLAKRFFSEPWQARGRPFGEHAGMHNLFLEAPSESLCERDGLLAVAGGTVVNDPAMVDLVRHHARLTEARCDGCCNNTLWRQYYQNNELAIHLGTGKNPLVWRCTDVRVE